MVYDCHPSYSGEPKIRKSQLRPACAKSKTLSQKITREKRARSVTQVVDQMPSNCEAKFKPQYHKKKKPGMVAHTCYSCKGESQFKDSPGQKKSS
jgi:hypothetical protein